VASAARRCVERSPCRVRRSTDNPPIATHRAAQQLFGEPVRARDSSCIDLREATTEVGRASIGSACPFDGPPRIGCGALFVDPARKGQFSDVLSFRSHQVAPRATHRSHEMPFDSATPRRDLSTRPDAVDQVVHGGISSMRTQAEKHPSIEPERAPEEPVRARRRRFDRCRGTVPTPCRIRAGSVPWVEPGRRPLGHRCETAFHRGVPTRTHVACRGWTGRRPPAGDDSSRAHVNTV
jgi:hypothetical protein